jgi:hypothetical protein
VRAILLRAVDLAKLVRFDDIWTLSAELFGSPDGYVLRVGSVGCLNGENKDFSGCTQ